MSAFIASFSRARIQPPTRLDTHPTQGSTTVISSKVPIPLSCVHATPLARPETSHRNAPAPALPARDRTVIWFRNDLRLHDHPALIAATSSNHAVAALLLTPPDATPFWLASARALRTSLQRIGGELHVRACTPDVATAVAAFCREAGATRLHFHRETEWKARRDETRVKRFVAEDGVVVQGFWSNMLVEPTGLPFRVADMAEDCDEFTKAVEGALVPGPVSAPKQLIGVDNLSAGIITGEGKVVEVGGEIVGLQRVADYVHGKSLMVNEGSSMGAIDTKFGRLGPFLTLGCVSPRWLWREVLRGVSEFSVRRYCAEFELRLRDFIFFMTLKKGVVPV